jgi:hypothetical protein
MWQEIRQKQTRYNGPHNTTSERGRPQFVKHSSTLRILQQFQKYKNHELFYQFLGGTHTKMNPVIIVLAFAFIGAGLKYIDDAFDEDAFSKKKALAIAPCIALIWICLSILDPFSATVLSAILFSVLVTGKIDNTIFKLCAAALISVLALTQFQNLLWTPLIFLTFMGVADEKGNDYTDTHSTSKLLKIFFSYRFCMKIGLLVLCALSAIPWLYLLAILAHDGAYEAVRIIGKNA